MTQSESERIARAAMTWLISETELLRVFLGASGLAPGDLRSGLDDVELQAAVLDFVLMEDAWIVQFAAQAGIDPTDPAQARGKLPGGELPNWT